VLTTFKIKTAQL